MVYKGKYEGGYFRILLVFQVVYYFREDPFTLKELAY